MHDCLIVERNVFQFNFNVNLVKWTIYSLQHSIDFLNIYENQPILCSGIYQCLL